MLKQKLEGVRRKHLAVSVATGLGIAASYLVIALTAQMAVDYRMELSWTIRAALLGAHALVLGWIFWRWVAAAIMWGPDEEEVALWVEQESGTFRNRLIASVQLTRAEALPAGASPQLVEALVRETESLAEPVRFASVVKTHRLLLAVLAAAVLLLGAAVDFALAGERRWPLIQRAMLVPGVEVPRQTRVTLLDADQVAGRGDAVQLSALAEGVIPRRGEIEIVHESGAVQRLPIAPDEAARGRFSRTVENVREPFAYIVYLNDGHSETGRVRVLARPAVADIELRQVYPAYTGEGTARRAPGDLRLLEGSRLMIDVTASTPVALDTGDRGNHIYLHGSEVVSPLIVDPLDRTRLTAGPDEDQGIPLPPGTSGFSIHLVDELGLTSRDPAVYPIDLIPDAPPSVVVTHPPRREEVVTASAEMLVGFSAVDDWGIASVRFRYRIITGEDAQAGEEPNGPGRVGVGDDDAQRAIDLDLGGQTLRAIQRRFEWNVARLEPTPAEGMTIEYWIEAEDANDLSGPGIGASERYRARVVSDAEKRDELMGRLGDYLEEIREAARQQDALHRRLGELIHEQTGD